MSLTVITVEDFENPIRLKTDPPMQPIPALPNPFEAHKPKLRRQVLSFEQALENLKHAKSGTVRCAAFHTFGQCSKEILLAHSDFLAHPDQLSIVDVRFVVKLMPLMFCPTHWEKTVYYSAMLLDWFSFTGSGLDIQDYENIVIDLESAKVINEEKCSPLEISTIQIHASHINTGLPIGLTSTASSTQASNTTAGLGDEKDFQTQDDPSSGDQPVHTAPQDEQADEDFPGTATLVNLNSYASLELGVAKLEIMYQESLKCISMASDGWRCQNPIQTEQLLQAQRLLSSLGDSEEELKGLAKLVLCPGHARGKLPQLYSETWSVFAAKRLPKEEAMSRFDPEYWMSVFSNHNTPQTELRKTKSTSNLPHTQFGRADYLSPDRAEVDSKLSAAAPKLPQKKRFAFNPAAHSFTFESPLPKSIPWFRSRDLSGESDDLRFVHQNAHFFQEIPSATASSIFTTPGISISISSSVPAPAADCVGTSSDSNNEANDRHATSTANTCSVFDRSASPPLSEKVEVLVPPTISPTGRNLVRLPPKPLGISSDVSNLSSEFAEIRLSGEASSYDCGSSVNTADAEDAAVSEDPRSDQTAQPPHSSAPSTSQRALKQLVPIVHQGVIDGNIIKEIRSSIPTGGYVYIFKSVSRNLVKIGKATDVARRKNQIKTGCQLEDLDEVESDSYHVKYPERVEKLVHLELQNFRVKFICQHSQEIEQEHREWFDVPENVAVQSVRRWRDFVETAYTPEGTIKEHWAKKATLMPNSSSPERRYLMTGLDQSNKNDLEKHHQLRHERYRNWIQDTHS